MTTTSLNISGKIDSNTIDLFETINKITDQLDIRYVVVGATARDIVMHHGYGADIQRATTDFDFGINVANWDAFKGLKDTLIAALEHDILLIKIPALPSLHGNTAIQKENHITDQ